MKMIREVTSELEFKNALVSDKPTIVEFYADWCMPCKMQNPIMKDFHAETLGRVQIISVDIDVLSALADRCEIKCIPTTALFVNGKMLVKSEGLLTKGKLCEMVIKYV